MLPLGLAAALALSPAASAPGAEVHGPSPGLGAGPEDSGTEGPGPDGTGAGLSAVRVELAEVRAELAQSREQASELIQDYRSEHERLAEATEHRKGTRAQAEAAAERAEGARSAAAGQAAAAYKGDDLSTVHAWTGPRGPADVLERGAYLHLLGERRSADLDRAEAARVASGALASAAESAETEQEEAAEEAERARERAEEAVRQQQERAHELRDEQTRLEEELADAGAPGTGGGTAEDAPRQDRSAPEEDGACETTEGADAVAAADNGRLPEAALCPLPQHGQQLRADAAEAFLGLDGHFRAEFGRSLCVTDSYRPYHEQVRLFQEMAPGMAADPGTSEHGLGLAVDLCGGVEQLGTDEHGWMLEHAPGHGWENPEWAREGFEPWHWEYTG